MLPCKQLNTRGWELLGTEVWKLGLVRLANGVLTAFVEQQNYWEKHRIQAIGSNKNQHVIIKIHQKVFKKELIIARSIFFFNHQQPTIQLWNSSSQRPQDGDALLFDIQSPRWQRAHYYRSVRLQNQWFRLEDDEFFSLPVIRRDFDYNISAIILEITKLPEKKEVVRYSIIP